MGNPYKFSEEELDSLVDTWREDDEIIWGFKDFFMWETGFTHTEFVRWIREGEVPVA